MIRKVVLLLAAVLVMGSQGFSQDYKVIADKSIVRWSGKKVGKNHVGKVTLKEGSFTIKGDKFTAGQFVIDMTSIVDEDLTDPSWNAKLIGHLKSEDFFGVEKYPTATLTMTESTRFEKDETTVKADLTIKGATHPVTFKVKRIGDVFQSTVTFDRSQYNVRYGSGKFFENLGDNAIDDLIPLDVTLVAVKK